MLDEALQYAARGWPVFRLTGYKTPWKGSHGHLDATTNAEQILEWWTAKPKANIGLATGEIVVLDLDGLGAIAQLQELTAKHGLLPKTLTSQTARGYHLFFRKPAGVEIRTRAAPRSTKGQDGIDIKGAGGYVMLPPSRNARTGFVYRWALQLPIADMPEWLSAWCQTIAGPKVTAQGTALVAQGGGAGARLMMALPSHLIERQQRFAADFGSTIVAKALKALGPDWNSAEQDRITAAVQAVPADCQREQWLHIGMALHSLGWERSDGEDAGFEIWAAWSRGGGDKFKGETDLENTWRSFRRGGVGIGTLFHIAQEHGWEAERIGPGAAGSGPQAADAVAGMNGAASADVFGMASRIVFPDVDAKGKARPTCRNARAGIEALGIDCSQDTFHKRLLVGGQVLGQYASELSDDTAHKLRMAIGARFGFDPGQMNTYDAAVQGCLANPFNPLLDYLHGLRWDGIKRIDTWLTLYLGAVDDPLTRAIARLVLVAAVRRATVPGSKFDQIIVLESPEGRGKSSAIEILAGKGNFSDMPILALAEQAQQEAMEGVWLYEIADLAGMARAEVERIKAFASRNVDRARPAYGRARVDRPRTCIFFATTNDELYLKSQVGNRRFWPVQIGRVDLESLKRDRDQLWAEAVEAEHAAGSITLPERLWGHAAQVQEARAEVDPWTSALEIVRGDFDAATAEYRITTRHILDRALMLPLERQSMATFKRVAIIMRKLGWDRKVFKVKDAPVQGYVKKAVLG